MEKPKIAIFDLSITSQSPAGSCVLQIIKLLADKYQFIVFADKFENPHPEKVKWIRVPLPAKPILFRYFAYYILAPFYFNYFKTKEGIIPDLILATEGEFTHCDICYSHFCHQGYLKQEEQDFSTDPGKFSLRKWLRLVNRRFNTYLENKVMCRAPLVVTPSRGLADEIESTYSELVRGKLRVVPNPIDLESFISPSDFNTEMCRQELGLFSGDLVFVFIALGDFQRKGLPILLQAVEAIQENRIKLLVVGGSPSEIHEFTLLSKEYNISDRVVFTGFQKDVKPFLWISQVFILPSAYETFSLVAFQAAAAGLPVIATQLFGVEEFINHGSNGWLIEREADSIKRVLELAFQSRNDLPLMGEQARRDVSSYGVNRFASQWENLFDKVLAERKF